MSNAETKSKPPSFFDLFRRNEASPGDIDDFVDRWHARVDEWARSLPLHDYLGLTHDEYEVWVIDDTVLPLILSARLNQEPFASAVADHLRELISRNATTSRVGPLKNWLDKNQPE